MPNIGDQEKVARKLLPIIYVLDTSGSMEGDRIAAVNAAMNETMEVLRDVSSKNPTAELKIGVLQFSSNASWITNKGLVFMEDFFWNDLSAGGFTDLGSALKELNKKMSREEFLDSDVGYKVPVIIFMSDGEPTDTWEPELQKVNNSNKWFKASTKIAIAVGDDANTDVLKKVVGNSEAVIRVDDLEALKKLIRVVSVTASMIGGKSKTDTDSTSQIMEEVKGKMGDDVQPVGGPVTTPSGDSSDPADPWSGSGTSGDPWTDTIWD